MSRHDARPLAAPVLLALLGLVLLAAAPHPTNGLSAITATFQSHTLGGALSHEAATALAVDGRFVYIVGTTTSNASALPSHPDVPPAPITATQMELAHPAPLSRTSPRAAGALPPLGRRTDAAAAMAFAATAAAERTDIFVAKLDEAGTPVWARRISTNGTDVPTGLLLHAGALYVSGSTTGSFGSRTSPSGTRDLLVLKLTTDGAMAWTTPVQLGSGGDDAACALSADAAHPDAAHIFVSGYTGGSLFPSAVPESRRGSTTTPVPESTRTAAQPTEHAAPRVPSAKVALPAELQDTRDMFLARISTSDGAVEQIAQLPLPRNNSGDALVVRDGRVYAAVNTKAGERALRGASALYSFSASDLSYRRVRTPAAYDRRGDFVQALAGDAAGGIYLGGITHRADPTAAGSSFLRKFDAKAGEFVWAKALGKQAAVEASVSVAVSKGSQNVFVTGFCTAAYTSGKLSLSLLRLPLVVFSAAGKELMTWDRTAQFPLGYEEMAAVAVDDDENVIYAGRRMNPSNRVFDALAGSFGSRSFTGWAWEPDMSDAQPEPRGFWRSCDPQLLASAIALVVVPIMVVGLICLVFVVIHYVHWTCDGRYVEAERQAHRAAQEAARILLRRGKRTPELRGLRSGGSSIDYGSASRSGQRHCGNCRAEGPSFI